MSEKIYTNEEMCAECKGACCKAMGCIYDAIQFYDRGNFPSVMELKKILKEGKISIAGQPATGFYGDAWTFVLYLKARDENAGVIDILGNGGPCSQLTDKGCKLKKEERPMFGKTVKPIKIGGPCKQTADAFSFAYNWLMQHRELEKIVEEYTGMEAEEYYIMRINEESASLKEKIKNNIELTPMEKNKHEWFSNIINNKPYVDNKFALDWMNSCMGF